MIGLHASVLVAHLYPFDAHHNAAPRCGRIFRQPGSSHRCRQSEAPHDRSIRESGSRRRPLASGTRLASWNGKDHASKFRLREYLSAVDASAPLVGQPDAGWHSNIPEVYSTAGGGIWIWGEADRWLRDNVKGYTGDDIEFPTRGDYLALNQMLVPSRS